MRKQTHVSTDLWQFRGGRSKRSELIKKFIVLIVSRRYRKRATARRLYRRLCYKGIHGQHSNIFFVKPKNMEHMTMNNANRVSLVFGTREHWFSWAHCTRCYNNNIDDYLVISGHNKQILQYWNDWDDITF